MTIKLTKKHAEIVEQVKALETEHGCTLYFVCDNTSGKIRPTKINLEEGEVTMTGFPFVCTHTVATTMESKGILIPEFIGKLNSGHTLTLLKLAV